MNTEAKVAALEGLLERVRRNAAKPRPATAPATSKPEASPPGPEIEVSGGDDVDDLLAAPSQPADSGPRSEMETMVATEQDIVDMEIEDFDEDIVDITDEEGGADIEITVDDDEPPASSRRPKPAASMDQALADAAAAEHEVPLKTPPPESGSQVAAPPIVEASIPTSEQIGGEADIEGADDVDSLLEADVGGTPGQVGGRPEMPTMEQLGSTIEIAGSEAPDAKLELETPAEQESQAAEDELEVAIPAAGTAAVYDAELSPPPEAKQELEELASAAPPAVSPSAPVVASPPPPASGPQVTARPAVDGAPADFQLGPKDEAPSTFLGVLDESLSL